jgi:hypothetical protein
MHLFDQDQGVEFVEEANQIQEVSLKKYEAEKGTEVSPRSRDGLTRDRQHPPRDQDCIAMGSEWRK